ncbi:hypothetical protein [Dyella jiangningensis]|uniref:hypothetical protein n=1 Tax=Dyella jiangningensis TaxID=1379159 RepID=UPI0011BF2830|nr:hypothetical protein [Dyella jiangningensis]
MTRKRLLALVACAACIGTAGAQGTSGRLTFEGRIVQPTCSADQPALTERIGCGVHAIDVERLTPAAQAADSVMLDYFIERTNGDATFALTRQYR